MDLEYENRLVNVENDVQDKSSIAWKKLCEYVDKVESEGGDEFSPYEYLGEELFFQIHTLPPSIAKLKKVKKIWLYGSRLKSIPPEIGEMESLEYFDPYTSYDLHWFPYEITRCKNLKDSRVSTRALYGNFKHRRPFPDLTDNPVRYGSEGLTCSVCNRVISYQETKQLWISLWVGTDVLPLLANLCSDECKNNLPKPPEDYIQFAHKGGKELKQPLDQWERTRIRMAKRQEKKYSKIDIKNLPLLKLVRKIWKK